MIVAAQAPHAAPLVAPVAVPAAAALAQLTYGAVPSVAVETCETTPMPYDDVYAMATPGRVFDMFTNQAHVLRAGGPRRPGREPDAVRGRPRRGGPHARERRADRRALPGRPARALPADARIDRRHHACTAGSSATSTLTRAATASSRALEGPLGAHGNLHLAGDYFAALGNIEAAARTARGRRTDRRPVREVHPMFEAAPRRASRAHHPLHRGRRALDTARSAPLVDRLSTRGVAGLVPAAARASSPRWRAAERHRLAEATVESAAGRVPVVAGTGALTTHETVELSRHAERTGAAAVMIVPPFYDAFAGPSCSPTTRRSRTRSTDPDHVLQPAGLHRASPSTAAQFRELRRIPVPAEGHRRGRRRRDRARSSRDGPTLLNGCDTLTFAALAAGVPRHRLGHRDDPARGMRRAPPPADRRHRPPGRARALGAPLAAVRVPRGPDYSAAVKTACGTVGDTTGRSARR